MNSTLILLPDSEAIAVAYLAGQPDVALIVEGRVYASLPEVLVWPFANVARIGGRPEPGAPSSWIDHAHLQIAGWSEDRDEAYDLCAVALGALHEIPQLQGLGVVTAVQDILGPIQRNDPETKRPRFMAEVLMSTHPLPEGS